MGFSLTPADRTSITAAIKAAEQGHRGEIVVHVEVRCFDALKRAAKLYRELGVDKTKEGTGVLLYIATETRRAAVWAGPGVKDGDVLTTWRPVFTALETHKNDEAAGIVAAVGALGKILQTQCAGHDKHGNELSDGVSS